MDIIFDRKGYSKELVQDWMVFRDTTEERDAVFGNLQSGYDLDSHIALEESWTAVLKKIDAEFTIEERQKFILDKLRQNYTWEKRKEAKLLEEYPCVILPQLIENKLLSFLYRELG